MGLIIEFIGAPGAGKTTLLPAVSEALRAQGIKPFTVIEAARPVAARTAPGKIICRLMPQRWQRTLLWQLFYRLSLLYRLKFMARRPRLMWLVVSSQRRRPPAAEVRARKVLHWFFRLAGYYEFLKAHMRPDEALLLDEGFVHRVVQLHASGVETPNPAQILAYVNLLPPPDLVIFTQAPPHICESRIYRRGLWQRFQHKSPAEISQFVVNACAVVNLTVAHLNSRRWPVIQVDNSADDPTLSAAALRRRLSAQMPPVAGERHSLHVVRES